jgi:hypothetical protein
MPVTFDRPIPAKLIVRLENGDEFEPSKDDFDKFGLVNRLDTYVRFEQLFTEALGIPSGTLTDDGNEGPNLIRYLAECAIMYKHSPWADEDGREWSRDDDDDEPDYRERLRQLFNMVASR